MLFPCPLLSRSGPRRHRRVRSVVARLLAVAALLGAVLLATAGDWPTYLHDPERTATSWDEALLSPSNARHLTRLWAFQTRGIVAASPIVAAGTVYVGSWDGYEYALNAATGALKWKTYLGKTTPSPSFCHVTFLPTFSK